MTTDRRTRPPGFIPPPEQVRPLLYRARMEAQLLARLLRLSEDRAKLFPAPPAAKGVSRD